MFYVYILQLRNKRYYIGYSTNLKQRLYDHKQGVVLTTKNQLPVQLVFYAVFRAKKKAVMFEKYLKTNSGFAFRNKHLV